MREADYAFGDLLRSREETDPRVVAFRVPGPDACELTVADVARRTRAIARGVLALAGDEPDATVAILSEPGLDAALCDLACLSNGIVDFPLPANAVPEQVVYMLRNSGARVLLASDDEQVAKVLPSLAALPELNEIHFGSFDGGPLETYRAWAAAHSPSVRAPGGGESRAEAAARFARGLRVLLERDEETILLVGHALALRQHVQAVAALLLRGALRLGHRRHRADASCARHRGRGRGRHHAVIGRLYRARRHHGHGLLVHGHVPGEPLCGQRPFDPNVRFPFTGHAGALDGDRWPLSGSCLEEWQLDLPADRLLFGLFDPIRQYHA